MRTTPTRSPWGWSPFRGWSTQRRSDYRSRARMCAWTSPAPRCKGSRAPRRVCSGAFQSRWRTPSANSGLTSPLGALGRHSRCCPGAWRWTGAPSAASPIFPPMTAGSRPSARWSPRCRSMGWLSPRWRTPTCGTGNRCPAGPVGGHVPIPGQGDCLLDPVQGSPRLPGDAHAVRAPALASPGSPATGSHTGLQVFTQAMWESGGCPPGTGPVGRALQTAATLGWSSRKGCWCWPVPGQEYPLHFVQEPLC